MATISDCDGNEKELAPGQIPIPSRSRTLPSWLGLWLAPRECLFVLKVPYPFEDEDLPDGLQSLGFTEKFWTLIASR